MPVTVRSAFMDWQSEEDRTGVVKSKYKLLTSKLLDIYLFHILTTTETSHPQEQRIKILPEDWEYRNGTHLNAPFSIIGCQHIDVLNDDQVATKTRTTGFPLVGTITQIKLSEIITFIKSYNSTITPRSDPQARHILVSMFEDRKITSDILNKLGL